MSVTEVVTESGVYDIPDEIYHADPVPGGSLSNSGARLLLPPHSPAEYDHVRRHGQRDTTAFQVGRAAHKQLLGVGQDIVEIVADNWRTKAAQEKRDETIAAGKIPLLTRDFRNVGQMTSALFRHRVAKALRDMPGKVEQSLFWQDPLTGVWLRARLDFLPDRAEGKRSLLWDYKTAESAHPMKFTRSTANFDYFRQAAWYLDAAAALGVAGADARFLFVVQEKEAPYLVSVIELDEAAIEQGRQMNRRAIDIYAQCREENRWPGYGEDVHLVSLPAWAMNQNDERMSA